MDNLEAKYDLMCASIATKDAEIEKHKAAKAGAEEAARILEQLILKLFEKQSERY